MSPVPPTLRHVARGFDRLAPLYDRLVWLVFGHQVQRIQTDLLHHLPPGAKILVMGGGTGWILAEMFRHSTPAQVTYLELSSGMMAQAHRRAQQAHLPTERITWRLGSYTDLSPDESYDAVLTFFFLDLFSLAEAEAVMDALHQVLRPGGKWLWADFVPQRSWQRALLWLMYRFFRLCCGISGQRLLPFEELFVRRGYQAQARYYRWWDMVQGAIWQRS